jgi:hypothetical protein
MLVDAVIDPFLYLTHADARKQLSDELLDWQRFDPRRSDVERLLDPARKLDRGLGNLVLVHVTDGQVGPQPISATR